MKWVRKIYDTIAAPMSTPEEHVVLNKQQLSWVTAGILLLALFVFIAGYFLGQQRAIEQFSVRVDQESLADKIYTSFCSVYDAADQQQSEEVANESAAPQENIPPTQGAPSPLQETSLAVQSLQVSPIERSLEIPQQIEQPKMYAEIAGFGTLKNAQVLAHRLGKKGITVNVVTRHSKTKKGKAITWYQVVTPKVAGSKALQDLVDTIKQEERLSSIRIVTC